MQPGRSDGRSRPRGSRTEGGRRPAPETALHGRRVPGRTPPPSPSAGAKNSNPSISDRMRRSNQSVDHGVVRPRNSSMQADRTASRPGEMMLAPQRAVPESPAAPAQDGMREPGSFDSIPVQHPSTSTDAMSGAPPGGHDPADPTQHLISNLARLFAREVLEREGMEQSEGRSSQSPGEADPGMVAGPGRGGQQQASTSGGGGTGTSAGRRRRRAGAGSRGAGGSSRRGRSQDDLSAIAMQAGAGAPTAHAAPAPVAPRRRAKQ